MTDDQSETWTQRIAWSAIVGTIIGGIAWAGWISIELNSKYNYTDTKNFATINELISLQKNVDTLSYKVEGKFSDTIKANTEAIIQLKEQMNYNNKILEKIINRLDKDRSASQIIP